MTMTALSPETPVLASPALRRLPLILCLLASVACAAPTVQETAERIVVANDHLTLVVGKGAGGMLAELKTADGRLITANHGLYTDRGIYGEDVYVGTGQAPVTTRTRIENGSVIVRAEGLLCDREGKPPADPGGIAYWVQYALGNEAAVRVSWGARPDFALDLSRGFLAYIMSVTGCVGVFANTDEGVLLQDIADHSTRTFQSASEPLSREAPWFGVLRGDDVAVAFTEPAAQPAFANVFLHEDGRGGAAVFFAWLDGNTRRSLTPEDEWRGAFILRVHPSFEAFGSSAPGLALPSKR